MAQSVFTRVEENISSRKIPDAVPVWIAHVFAKLGIYARGFSKYGAYYEAIVLNGAERTEKKYA